MFRVSLVLANLLEVAAWPHGCPQTYGCGCNFDVTVLEEFSMDTTVVSATDVGFTAIWAPGQVMASHGPVITTAAVPDTFPSEHGNIAVHARNLQLKLDNHVSFPDDFAFGRLPLSGMQIHEELHINGVTGQASFHFASPILNVCFQVDGLPPVAQIEHNQIEQNLQQAEQMLPQIAKQAFYYIYVDAEIGMGPAPQGRRDFPTEVFTDSSHPLLIHPKVRRSSADYEIDSDEMIRQQFHPTPDMTLWDSIAVKFSNYNNTVGNQFGVRACEITDQSSTQSLLAATPDAREFLAHRIAQHQKRLQAVLHPNGLNTRFNFINLEIADLMIPAGPHCTTDELAQVPGTTFSTLQTATLCFFSMAMAVVVTSTAMRKKFVNLADGPLLQ